MALDLLDAHRQPVRQRHAAGRNAEQDDIAGAVGALKDLVRDSANVGAVGSPVARSGIGNRRRISLAIEDALGDVGLVRAYRAGAGDVDGVTYADGAGEADDGLEGGTAADVFADHDVRSSYPTHDTMKPCHGWGTQD